MFINTNRAISLKNYITWEKKGDCVCHVLPEYNEDPLGYNSYRDLTCALEEESSRVPIFGEANTQNLSIKSFLHSIYRYLVFQKTRYNFEWCILVVNLWKHGEVRTGVVSQLSGRIGEKVLMISQ